MVLINDNSGNGWKKHLLLWIGMVWPHIYKSVSQLLLFSEYQTPPEKHVSSQNPWYVIWEAFVHLSSSRLGVEAQHGSAVHYESALVVVLYWE